MISRVGFKVGLMVQIRKLRASQPCPILAMALLNSSDAIKTNNEKQGWIATSLRHAKVIYANDIFEFLSDSIENTKV